MRSLRARAILGGTIWAALIVLVAGVSLYSFFITGAERRFNDQILEHLTEVVVALAASEGDPGRIASFLNVPAYERPYSGLYWQIAGEGDIYMTSRSLFDAFLDDPADPGPDPQIVDMRGPVEELRAAHQLVTLPDGSRWVVVVGQSKAALAAELQEIRQNLFSALGLIGALGVAAATLLTTIIMRPLTRLREEVGSRWDEGRELRADDYPEEVAPLVQDINILLQRNREIVERARRQAADMAHALKTPSAILRNELEILGIEGVDVAQAQDALARIDAQLMRSLARIRAANSGSGFAERIEVKTSIDRMARLFRSMHEPQGQQLQTDVPEGLKVPMDVQDLEEVLGNMMENAFKYCRKTVRVTARREGEFVRLDIEDDGPGIAPDKREDALRSGVRLDTSKPGTGLGLAIAQDLLQAYGGGLELSESNKLGGLKVICTIPVAPNLQSITRAAA